MKMAGCVPSDSSCGSRLRRADIGHSIHELVRAPWSTDQSRAEADSGFAKWWRLEPTENPFGPIVLSMSSE